MANQKTYKGVPKDDLDWEFNVEWDDPKNVRAGITTGIVVQVIVIIALIVGIVLAFNYDKDETGFKVGMGMIIGSGSIMALEILSVSGLLGVFSYKINK